MANSFFSFKQFTIHQDQCAMKVCTDACLFGAWTASYLSSAGFAGQAILDIGSGTGLLSLMLAQQLPNAHIDTVELDTTAAIQAEQNFQSSPWKERIQMYQADIKEISLKKKYDFIISNPPFFENDLKTNSAARNLALHSQALSLEELINTVSGLISVDGEFGVLLPFHRSSYFEAIAAKQNFYTVTRISIRQTPHHDYFRSILCFSKKSKITRETSITIKDELNEYSVAFSQLLKDYYLFL